MRRRGAKTKQKPKWRKKGKNSMFEILLVFGCTCIHWNICSACMSIVSVCVCTWIFCSFIFHKAYCIFGRCFLRIRWAASWLMMAYGRETTHCTLPPSLSLQWNQRRFFLHVIGVFFVQLHRNVCVCASIAMHFIQAKRKYIQCLNNFRFVTTQVYEYFRALNKLNQATLNFDIVAPSKLI